MWMEIKLFWSNTARYCMNNKMRGVQVKEHLSQFKKVLTDREVKSKYEQDAVLDVINHL